MAKRSNSAISKADQEILDRIHKRRDIAFEAEKDRRKLQLEDVEFCDPANQWPEGERAKRKAQSRPCLTVDRTNPFIDQLVNEERQNRPAMTVNPINDGADQETAEVIQGYFRHIELNSNADFAYDRASEAQKRGGFGFIRVLTDYVDDNSFDQDIKIGSVPNPFMGYIDPASTEPDGSDAQWGFFEEDFDQDTFKEKFPDALLTNMSSGEWQSVGDAAPDWLGADGKTVRVVEYYEIEYKPITICLGDDGKSYEEGNVPKGVKVKKTRPSNKKQIKWYKVCANQILDRRDVPGAYIPIVPVYGKELIINGKRDYRGVVRGMKDVQRMINVWKSAQTEAIGLAPRAPWIVALGSLPDGDKTWQTANTTNYSTLFYKAFDAEGRQMPQPTRNIQEPAIQAITVALQESQEDMKAVTGMYDPSLGNRGNADQSGVAIKSLVNQGLTSNFHFTDNFNRSLRQVGRICLSMLPEVVDAERLLRIVGIDGKQGMVKVNTSEPSQNPLAGISHIYDLTAGKYDVEVVAGPSFASKRQENTTQLINLAKIVPQVAQLGADILVKNMDFPAAQELADRVTPPQFKKQDGQNPIPPEVTQHVQQLNMTIEQLTKALNEAQDKLDAKMPELEFKREMAILDAQTRITVAEISAKSAEASLAFAQEMKEIQHLRDSALKGAQIAASQAPSEPQEPSGEPSSPSPGVPPAGPSAGQEPPNNPMPAIPAGEGAM